MLAADDAAEALAIGSDLASARQELRASGEKLYRIFPKLGITARASCGMSSPSGNSRSRRGHGARDGRAVPGCAAIAGA
jgi:hypothetical protein